MLEIISEFLFWFVFDVLFIWTGEVILYLITFGKHRPRWDLYTEESPSRFVIFSELSFWVGVVFWIAVVVLAYKLLAGN